MATDWYIEGLYMKNCNCDPGCPCDFNQRPTQGFCEGMIGMHITKGHFGEVDLGGVTFAGVVHWPGPIHEGKGEMQPMVDEKASEEQRNALFEALSGKHGDSLFEVMAYVCPTIHEPVVTPIDFDIDLETRSAHIKAGDVLEADIGTLRGIEPPELTVGSPAARTGLGDRDRVPTLGIRLAERELQLVRRADLPLPQPLAAHTPHLYFPLNTGQ